jgi:hypothetical protein
MTDSGCWARQAPEAAKRFRHAATPPQAFCGRRTRFVILGLANPLNRKRTEASIATNLQHQPASDVMRPQSKAAVTVLRSRMRRGAEGV